MKKNYIAIFTFIFCSSIYCQTPGIKIKNSHPKIESRADKMDLKIKGDSVYKTREIILYNFNNLDIMRLKEEISSLESELYQNSLDEDPTNRLPLDSIKNKNRRIEQKDSELARLNEKNDSLYHLYTKDWMQFTRINFLNFGVKRSEAFFDLIYDEKSEKRFHLLNNTGFAFGDNSGTLYSELVSGNILIFRASLGTLISNSSLDEIEEMKREEAYQRLASYGGNTVLTLEYPIAYIHSRNNQFNFITRFVAKGAADFPAFGTQTDKFAGSFQYGIDMYADASLKNNELRFFSNFNVNGVSGTDVFQENLGIDNSHFSFGQLSAGIIIAQNIKLSFTIMNFSSEEILDNNKVIIGGQILH